MELISAITCFVSSFILDVIWALYVRRTTNGKAVSAAILAGLIMAFGAINTIYFVQNHWNIIFSVVGAIIGTWITIKIETGSDKLIKTNAPKLILDRHDERGLF